MLERAIQFKLNNREGKVIVSYTANEDPKESGYDYLCELGLEKDFDYSQCLGFPTMRARVSYESSGYRSLLGWIQVVTTNSKIRQNKTELIHDKYPSFSDIDFPFGSYGYLPSFYDAPSTWNPDSRRDYEWRADTFLTTFPILSRESEAVNWICGIRWGYNFDKDPKRPTLAPFDVTGSEVWNEKLTFLRQSARSWRFEAARSNSSKIS